MEYTAIPGKPRWIDLSPQHSIAKQGLQSRLLDFFNDKPVAPLAIVGAFGSGKSELMSVGYRMAWEHEVPAFWVNLEDILRLMPETLAPAEFTDWLNQKIASQIEALAKWLEGEDRARELLMPHPREVITAEDYFGWVEIPIERAKSAVSKSIAVFFMDEMEAHYTDLLSKVRSDDRAPLRVLQQAVEQRQTSFLLVMSFGLASAYEALSGADARRRGFLPVPLPGPSEFGKNLLNTDALTTI